VLRLYDRDAEGRLHLLRLDEQHARVLLLLKQPADGNMPRSK